MLRLALAPLLVMLAAATAPPVLLREQAWTASSSDLAHHLTHRPRECAQSRTSETEIGRALFRAPVLFGGPTARLGLSCQSCHSSGRVNAQFFLPELTDRAGAADVTSEWASHVRGDGIVNPVDIPDLAGVAERPSYGHGYDPSLEHFVHGVVVEEFQGAEAPQQASASLLAYLRDLRVCTAGEEQITLAGAAEDVRRTLAATEHADVATARLLLLAGQDNVARIAERLPARRFGSERRALEALSRELGRLRNAGDLSAASETVLPGWRVRFDAVAARIARRENRTYFNETTLRAALER